MLVIEVTRKPDGLWHAHAPTMPGAEGVGTSAEEARDQARMAAAQIIVNSAQVTERDGWFFVYSELVDMSNQGETLDDAKAALTESIFAYLSDD